MRALFFWCLGVIAFTYFGYPLSLLLLRVFRHRPVRKGSLEPDVSIIVAAHNEESNLAAKLDNLLATDYPDQKREIVVVSDGCSYRNGRAGKKQR
jgi:cellulose synthase/poly-beta-1,6-N-acetylglucosamine synthase-like glycosyltransferase